jgi:hypothetical protein
MKEYMGGGWVGGGDGSILLILSIFIIYYLHTNVFYIGNEANDVQLGSCGSFSGSSLSLIFCIHVRSGPIYLGGVFTLQKKL